MLPAGVAPDGYAIPFSFYDRFMREGGFYDDAREIIGDPRRRPTRSRREKALDKLRKKMKKADLPAELEAQIAAAAGALRARHADPLSLVDEQRGPRGLQRRRPL